MASFSSSSYYINALLLGYSWTGTTGSPSTVSYSYQTATTASDSSNGLSNGMVLSSTQKASAEQALQSWENVANIRFNETSSTSAPILLRQATMPAGTAGWMDPTASNSTTFSSADMVFDSAYNANPALGTYQYTVFLHEIGHALGLKHPGDYSELGDYGGPYLSSAEDNTNLSIMSYYAGNSVSTSGYALTPMIYDIASAQFLYGANTSYNAGDTLYSLTDAKAAFTIWDGGGTDTLDSTSFAGGVILDLRAGKDNISRVGNSSEWIAFNANIENATSGLGSDTLYGNGLNNVLIANAGADNLYGFEGIDTLYGNMGNDTLYGGGSNDTLYGGKENDTLYGGTGISDSIDGADLIYGGEGTDVIYGNAGNDTLSGGTAIIDPTDSADTLYGGMGNDVIYGNGGNDVFYSGGGNDTLYGGGGNDAFFIAAGDGVDVIHGFRPEDDRLYFSSTLFGSAESVLQQTLYNEIGAVITYASTNSLTLTGLVPGSIGLDQVVIV